MLYACNSRSGIRSRKNPFFHRGDLFLNVPPVPFVDYDPAQDIPAVVLPAVFYLCLARTVDMAEIHGVCRNPADKNRTGSSARAPARSRVAESTVNLQAVEKFSRIPKNGGSGALDVARMGAERRLCHPEGREIAAAPVAGPRPDAETPAAAGAHDRGVSRPLTPVCRTDLGSAGGPTPAARGLQKNPDRGSV